MARQLVRASSQWIHHAAASGVTAYPVTLAAWVYPDTLPAVAWVCQVGSSSTAYVGIPTVATVVRAQVANGLATLAASPSSTMVTGQWQHVCAVFQASGAGSLAIYHNGVSVGTNTNNRAWPTQSAVRVGAALDNANPWDGKIAEFGVWNVALTVDEIASLAKGVPPSRMRPEALRVYWPLWGAHSPEPDLSGTTKSGTVTGATLANHSPTGPTVLTA